MFDVNGRFARLLLGVLLPWGVLTACSKSAKPGEPATPAVDGAPGAEGDGATMATAMPVVVQPTIDPMAPMAWIPTFDSHLVAGMPEQDVFLESAADATMVMRPDVGAENDPAMLATEMFGVAEAESHDPFRLSPTPLGPFAKGAALGFTLQQWLAATGTGNYTTESGKATLDVAFEHLVPNGTYTLWCTRLTLPPEVSANDLPCGAPDGSENSFTANAEGAGSLQLVVAPLLPSDSTALSMLALAYHSDGESHGTGAGDFGLNSHVQLIWMLPAEVVTQ